MLQSTIKKRKIEISNPNLLHRLHKMPSTITANILSNLTKENRNKTDNKGEKIPEFITPPGGMANVQTTFTNIYKAESYINDPTVTLVEKVAIIADANVSDDIRKTGLKKDDIVLSIHALRQTDINFTPKEIEAILSHSDRGIVGTLIENTSVALSNTQIQEQWDKNEPFIRAMIIKSGRSEQIDILNADKVKYDPNNHAARTAHSNTNIVN